MSASVLVSIRVVEATRVSTLLTVLHKGHTNQHNELYQNSKMRNYSIFSVLLQIF